MEPNKLTTLVMSGKRYQRSRGQTIQPYDTEGINLVESGYIKRYLISKDGTISIQSIFGPGQLFPLTTVYQELLGLKLNQGTVQYFYGAISDVTYCAIASSVLAKEVAKDPMLYRDLLEQTGNRLRSNIQQVENMSFRSAYRRVAHELVYLARHFGEETPAGLEVQVPLTQQDLSDILNLSRETVSREVAKLRERGMLAPGQRIVVTDIDRLEAIYS